MGLAGELGEDENDPRQMARLMRRLAETTGMRLGEGLEEAIARLEAGEDPETVEADMGDILDDVDLFSGGGRKLKRKFSPPARDETLYPL